MAHHDEYNTFGRLDELHDYKVADGYPDIRGWDVYTDAGQKIGKVDELIVDTTEMRVLYIDVDLDGSIRDEVGDAADSAKAAVTPGPDHVERGHTLLPIGTARIDDDKDQIVIDRIDLGTIGSLPRYDGRKVTREYEAGLRNRFGAGASATGMAGTAALATSADAPSTTGNDRAAEMARGEDMARWYGSEHYDDQRLFASRRNRGTGVQLDDSGIGDLGITRPDVEGTRDATRRGAVGDAPAGADVGEQEIHMQVAREGADAERRAGARRETIVRRNATGTDDSGDMTVRRERAEGGDTIY